jgi:hypothetical protein
MIWLAGMPGARGTRLTPSKETCRLSKNVNTSSPKVQKIMFCL